MGAPTMGASVLPGGSCLRVVIELRALQLLVTLSAATCDPVVRDVSIDTLPVGAMG